MSAAAVEIDQVRKSYGSVVALDDVSAVIQQGEVHALVGPNGAGKTTLMEIVCGLLAPTSGSVRVFGRDPLGEHEEVARHLAVAPQFGSLFERLTVEETVELWSTLYRSGAEPREVLDIVGLGPLAERQVKNLSGGESRRLLLALVLAARTGVALLDEPTTSLDPQGRADIWAEIDRLRMGDVTIFLSTHLLEEAERVADIVHIISEGRLLASGSATDLIRRNAGRAQVRFWTVLGSPPELRRALGLADEAALSILQSNGVRSQVSVEAVDADNLCRRVLNSPELAAEDLRVHHGTLEDVFFALTGRRRPEPQPADNGSAS